MSMSLLQVSRTGKQLGADFAVSGLSFEMQKGQNIGIAGATGSGKSTLLKLIAGLEDADTGSIFFEQQKVKGPAYRLIPGQPGIAYLSQHYELRNHYRMEELLSYANTLPQEETEALFRICRIDHLLQRKTTQLSGGEKQRIALARLLLTAPRLLLLDEPFSNLDLIHKTILKKVLDDLAAKGLSCIIASHDPLDLLSWANTLLILKEGKLVQQGSPQELYARPEVVYTGALLGKYNLLPLPVAALWDIAIPTGKHLFLRPEQFKATVTKGKGVKTMVEKVSFWGSYDEVAFRIADETLWLRAEPGKLVAGQIIYVNVPEHDFWYL